MANSYVFYYIMNYPLPLEEERRFLKFSLNHIKKTAEDVSFSAINSEILDDLLEQIRRYQYLFKKIPFLKGAFVANSISFRGVHKSSDIDIFFVVQKNRLWIARLFARWIFKKIKTTKKNKYKRFCLSFWIEEDQLDLKKIALLPVDIYLIYWIAHTVPIFSGGWDVTTFYKSNSWIKEFLPSWEPRQTIDLGIPLIKQKTISGFPGIKGYIGDLINNLIYILWHPIMVLKALINKEDIGRGTIIKKWMVKIHRDIRSEIMNKILA